MNKFIAVAAVLAAGLWAPVAEAAWVNCATEGAVCSFSGTKTVRYGAGTKFATKTATNSILCGNASFGDPAYGVAKSCAYDDGVTAPTTPPVQTSWIPCASEGSMCMFTGTKSVRFGADTRFVTKTLSNGTVCSTAAFGDPAYGVHKSCSYLNAGTVTPTTPTTPTTPSQPPTASGSIPSYASIQGKRVVGRIDVGSNQVIENLHITTTSGPCIVVAPNATNVIIRNNEIGPCGTATFAQNHNDGVLIQGGATNITIQRNVIHDVSAAVYAGGARHPVIVDRNYIFNIRGPVGGFVGGFYQGNMVQFNGMREGTASSRITCNVKDDFTRNSSLPRPTAGAVVIGDHISMFRSLGLDNAPVEIAYNRIRGGLLGGDRSGTCIQSGDGGDMPGGNYNIHDNTLVQCNGNGASFVVGGKNVRIERNIVDSRGENQATMTSWPFQIRGGGYPCVNINFNNNRATVGKGWAWDGGRDVVGVFNHQCAIASMVGNNFTDAALTARTPAQNFSQEYAECR